jgi:hypothetical protein
VGGGGTVINLNNCPVLCPGTSIIKSVSGCPSSGGSSSGGSKQSSSTSSSSSSGSYSTKNDEMRILGYLEGCQGSNAVFNSTIENNQIFKKAYGSGSDCSDDLMANVQQIMHPSNSNNTLSQHEIFLQCYNSVQNPQVRHALESIPNFLPKYEKMITKNMTGDIPIPSITGNHTKDIQIMQASTLTDNEIIACMKGVPPMTNSTLVLLSSIVPASSHDGCHAYDCNPVPCKVAPSVMCYTAFNVNLNTTIQLANPLSYPNTTIDVNGCGTDFATQQQDILKEKQQAPAMYASDAKDIAKSPIDIQWWCGIQK